MTTGKILKVALDTSGSMSGDKYNNAVLGVQQIWKADFTEKYFKEISTYAKDEFKSDIYRIAGATGGTPLYESLVSILEGLAREEKVQLLPTVVCVFTDGGDTEGFPKNWDRNKLTEAINYYTGKNVTFTFICTTQDARNIKGFGIPEDNIITHNNTGAGVAQVMEEYVLALNAYSKDIDLGINNTRRFFKKNLVGSYTPTITEYFSETSYFKLLGLKGDNAVMLNIGTNEEVEISKEYVRASLTSASNSTETVKVGKEDKYWTAKQIEDCLKKDPTFVAPNVGDLKLEGIKTIWDNISSQVFTVTYRKVGKELSAKAYEKLLEEKANEVLTLIEEAKNSKKGVAKAASTVIVDLLKNPITKNVEGELRVLTGRKLQFSSQDGFFKVVDFEVTDGQPRSVNINTVEAIIVNGVKYILD